MGTVCNQCQTYEGKLGNLPIDALSDPDQPERSYAFQENVKYEVPCNVNHIFAEIPQQNIPDNIQRGKKFQNSYFLIPYSVYYTGEWKKGRPHGIGDIVFQNGSVLRGIYNEGQVNGQDCILIMEDGSYYRGGIKNNAFNGFGKFTEKNGHTYEGLWQNNAPHGKGVQIFANGDSYQGEYAEGKKKGENGVYRWNNHNEYIDYTGQFQNDYMNGQGTLHKQNGIVISGIFRDGDIENAVIKNRQFQYRGQVKNGLLEGNGVLRYLQQNKVYEGKFKNGQPHGQGTLTDAHGQKKQGLWFKGNLITNYKGFNDQQLQKYLSILENELESKTYAQDVAEGINFDLRASGLKTSKAELIETTQTSQIKADKYIVYNLGEKSLIISEVS